MSTLDIVHRLSIGVSCVNTGKESCCVTTRGGLHQLDCQQDHFQQGFFFTNAVLGFFSAVYTACACVCCVCAV